jgi:hypothetical protein
MDEQPLEWSIDDNGEWHPLCPTCSELYTNSLVTALTASAVEQNVSLLDRTLAYFSDFHAQGHNLLSAG